MFTPEQTDALKAKLDSKNVETRSQSGRTLSYLQGWWTISEANRIFGFEGWYRETLETRMVAEAPRKLSSGKDGWGVSYVARVRVSVILDDRTVIRDGTGAGHGIDVDLGLAHESAVKEAETDALKRALMTFGNPFGLALYDKTQVNVERGEDVPKSAYAARRDGDWDALKTEMLAITDVAELEEWAKTNLRRINKLPSGWLDDFQGLYDDHLEAMRDASAKHRSMDRAYKETVG